MKIICGCGARLEWEWADSSGVRAMELGIAKRFLEIHDHCTPKIDHSPVTSWTAENESSPDPKMKFSMWKCNQCGATARTVEGVEGSLLDHKKTVHLPCTGKWVSMRGKTE